jgi:hypothetical protein
MSHCGIQVPKRPIIFNQLVLSENGRSRAFRDTRLAIDALIGVNVQHPLPVVKTMGRTDDDTVGESAPKAPLGHHVRHR